MRYIISTVTNETLTTWKPEEFRKKYFRWTAQEVFQSTVNWADPAGTWQEWLVTNDVDEVMTEWERIKKLTGLTKADVFNGRIRWTETVYMLEADNEDEEDPNQIDLLDWHAEGYEHEPEDEWNEE